jgi:hypothetical protein
MPRLEEDQPNVDLPVAHELPEQAQHWRVRVPRPRASVLVGQRVPQGEHEPAMGYPGLSVATEASFFADIAERTTWQGHQTIAFQSPANTELHAGGAVVLGATGWKALDPTSGERLGQVGGQNHLYKQIRDQALGFAAAGQAKALNNVVKTMVNYPFLDFPGTPLALFGLATAGYALGSAIEKEVKLGRSDHPAPSPGLYLTSHQGVFLASNFGTSINAATTFSVMAGATASVHAGATATYSAGIKLELFANAKVGIGAGYGVDVAALWEVNLTSKLGNAKVRGKTVEIGKQTPGSEVFKGVVAVTPFFSRPTETVRIEALKSITADVVGKFEINAPLGHVSTLSRKVTMVASEKIELMTPLGQILIDGTSIRIKRTSGPTVTVSDTGIQISTRVASIKVGVEGSVDLSVVGGSVKMMPGGVISVSGTIVKLG